MHYYIYLSENKIDMLYDQINDVTEVEDLYGGGFSLFGASGERSQLQRKKKNLFKKLQTVRDQLKKENNIGSFTEGKEYFEVTTESHSFLLRDGIVMWICHVYEEEHKTLYKIVAYGSPKNLISHDESYTRGGSSMHAFYTLTRRILQELFNTKDVCFESVNFEHGRGIMHQFSDKSIDQMTIEEMVDGLFWWGEQHQMSIQGMYGGCKMLLKGDYRSSYMLPKEDATYITYPLNKSDKIEKVVYIIGSPLYVESLNTEITD